MTAPAGESRIAALDMIRGVAVLGILTINIAGFANPSAAVISPDLPETASRADTIAFAVSFVLFEGKMRALFTLLFGASMALFLSRTPNNGESGIDPRRRQLRRLLWLLLFGQLHYFLLWWGDILFLYAMCGLALLVLADLSPRTLALGGVALILATSAWGIFASVDAIAAESVVAQGAALPEQAREHADTIAWIAEQSKIETTVYRQGYGAILADKVARRPFWLIEMTRDNVLGTLGIMMLGMAFARATIQTRRGPTRRLLMPGLVATAFGLGATALACAWLVRQGFPPVVTSAVTADWLTPIQVITACGYASLSLAGAPALQSTRIGMRLAAAGRMAFSNYVATSLVMTSLFYGWGLGLFAQYGEATLWLFVVAGWALMLLWSEPWLTRFRHGPLEWLWRSLVDQRLVALRR